MLAPDSTIRRPSGTRVGHKAQVANIDATPLDRAGTLPPGKGAEAYPLPSISLRPEHEWTGFREHLSIG